MMPGEIMPTEFILHVGYDDHLHPVSAVNFQMNRWINYLGDSALDEFRAIAPRLTDFPSYRREFLAIAEKALAEGRKLHAAYFFRSAEFFMWRNDPYSSSNICGFDKYPNFFIQVKPIGSPVSRSLIYATC
jgi:hypothetical protein